MSDRVPDYPTTGEEWWAAVDRNLTDLRSLVDSYHPASFRPRMPMKITAPSAERVCEGIRREVDKSAEEKVPPTTAFDLAVKNRDGDALVVLLNQVWFGVPESTDCWSIAGFNVLCDLCSESHVLHEDGMS